MATDATGTPTTSLGIPKYNTGQDIPSGKGFNAAMDFIDDLIEARSTNVPGASGAKVWNNTSKSWEAPTGSPDGTKFLRDDGAWAVASSDMVRLFDLTLSSDVANFDITSIDQGYAQLTLRFSTRDDNASVLRNTFLRFNNDSGANYDTYAVAGGAGLGATSAVIGYCAGNNSTANVFAIGKVEIIDYANTTRTKSLLYESFIAGTTGSGGTVGSTSGGDRWLGTTAAINRITVIPASGNFKAGSRVTLYGLR